MKCKTQYSVKFSPYVYKLSCNVWGLTLGGRRFLMCLIRNHSSWVSYWSPWRTLSSSRSRLFFFITWATHNTVTVIVTTGVNAGMQGITATMACLLSKSAWLESTNVSHTTCHSGGMSWHSWQVSQSATLLLVWYVTCVYCCRPPLCVVLVLCWHWSCNCDCSKAKFHQLAVWSLKCLSS